MRSRNIFLSLLELLEVIVIKIGLNRSILTKNQQTGYEICLGFYIRPISKGPGQESFDPIRARQNQTGY